MASRRRDSDRKAHNMRITRPALVIGSICSTLLSQAHGELVETWSVGSGAASAEIQIDFMNGNTYVFDLAFEGEIRGRDVFDLVRDEAATIDDLSFDFSLISYSFGDFLTGITLNQDSDYGEGSPPDYLDTWAYWTAEGAGDWSSSMIGFSDRILVDGSRDAWVFGTGAGPATIPAPATVAFALFLRGGRARRR